MPVAVVIGTLAAIAFVTLGAASLWLLEDLSEHLATRIGVATVRLVTVGRYPKHPLSPVAEVSAGIFGAVVMVALAVVAVYTFAAV